LVALNFIPNPEGKLEVNHKNLNRKDNRKTNLEWNTRKENNHHAIEMGAITWGSTRKGAKLNEESVREIKKLIQEKVKQRDIAKQYSISETTISEIKHNKYWKSVTEA
jgi:hypothetical protein